MTSIWTSTDPPWPEEPDFNHLDDLGTGTEIHEVPQYTNTGPETEKNLPDPSREETPSAPSEASEPLQGECADEGRASEELPWGPEGTGPQGWPNTGHPQNR